MKVRKPKNLSDLFDMLENLEDIYNKGKNQYKRIFWNKDRINKFIWRRKWEKWVNPN